MSFLIISVDDLAAFTFLKSLYAGTVHTPNIDRLMAMGTTFENGFAPVALCNPSRTATLTGLSSAHTGVHNNAIEYWNAVEPEDLLMANLMNAGYHTSIIGKVLHSTGVPAGYGAQIADIIFESRTDVGGHDIGVLDESDRARNGDEINVDQAIELLQSYAAGDPFAMFVGINKPHLNWVVPQEFYDLYPIDEIVMPENPNGDMFDIPWMGVANTGESRWAIDPEDAGPEAMQAYLAAVSYADHLVGQLLDQVEASGLDGETTIILWTDHGHHLGDKDHYGKFTLWDTAARAPFVIAQPGEADDGQVVRQVVELIDLMPTVMDLAGLAPPAEIDGRSLVQYLDNPDLIEDTAALTTMNGSISIRTNDFRLIRYADSTLELYEAADTGNIVNLAKDPAYADVVDDLVTRLLTEAALDGWVLGSGTGNLVGTDADETLVPFQESDIYGGGGNDTYQLIWSPIHRWSDIHEEPDGGYDTLRTDVMAFTVPDNVERVIATVNARVTGTDAGETIIGGGTIYALGGNDYINARDGDDYIDPGRGDDFIKGGYGFNTLDYSLSTTGIHVRWRIVESEDYGRDVYEQVQRIIGSPQDDVMFGTNKADTFEGGFGYDTLRGELGDDVLRGDGGNDQLFGDDGNDTLEGGWSWDHLEGGTGFDKLDGGNGNDVLIGGNGMDFLTGGSGADTFRYESISHSSHLNPDRIMDLETGDTIDLSAIDADTSRDGDQAFTFIGTDAFTGVAGQLRYQGGWLAGDVDGDGACDFVVYMPNLPPIETVADALLL